MDEQITGQQALAAVNDPETPGAVLQEIAAQHPELWPQIAAHPQAYPGLLAWLDGHGDASVRYIVAARRAGMPTPVANPGPTRAEAAPTPQSALLTTVPIQTRFQANQAAYAQPVSSQPAPPTAAKRGGSKKALIIILCVLLMVIGVGVYLIHGRGTSSTRNYGDGSFQSVTIAPDGSIIAAGVTFRNPEGASQSIDDATVAKVRPDGTVIWTKTYPGGGGDMFQAVTVAPDGSIIAVGYTTGGGDFPATKGGQDAVIAKISPDGSLVWAKTYGGSDMDWFTSVAIDPDGSILAAGFTSGGGDFPVTKGFQDAVIAKISPDGALDWLKTYGGSADEWFYSVAIAPDGGIVTVGYTSSTDGDFSANKGGMDAVIAKVSPDGTLEWAKTYGGSNDDWFSSVTIAQDGGIVTVGDTDSTDGDLAATIGNRDAVVAKIGADGNLNWSKTYGGSDADYFYSVGIARDGSIVTAGVTKSTDGDFPALKGGFDAAVAKIEADGTLNWAKTYGGSSDDEFDGVAVTSDGSIVAVGQTASADGDFPTTGGGKSAVLARLTADGSLS